MKAFEFIWVFTKDHLLEIAGLLVAYFSLIVPIQQYLGQRKLEEKDKRFNNYHRLIKELVGDNPTLTPFLDRQIAIIFELRNYTEYYEVTERILNGLFQTWSTSAEYERLSIEIQLTLEYIKRRL